MQQAQVFSLVDIDLDEVRLMIADCLARGSKLADDEYELVLHLEPTTTTPTPAELDILNKVWDRVTEDG